MKILKSATLAFGNFDVEAAEYAERLRQWCDHMKRVEDDKAKGDAVAPIDRHQPFDRPRAHPLIEAAIDDNFNVSYELEDDTESVLRLQKNALLSRVAEIEAAAVAAIVAPGRRRLFNMREDQIRIADADRAAMLAEKRVKPGLLKKLTGAATEEDIAAAVAEQRPAEDTKHLAEQEERRRRVREVEQLAAQAMHDIEDLTAETIGSWQAPDFSGV